MKIDKVELIQEAFSIAWLSDMGFGRFTFFRKGDVLYLDDEYMGKEAVIKALVELVDEAKLTREEGND